MPRYPVELVERIKREVSVRSWLEARGCVFAPHGRDVVCRCPLPGHEDRTPSFVVSAEKNLWHCLGACQAGGSVLDLVMRLEGCDFRTAVEMVLAAHPRLADAGSAGTGSATAAAPLAEPAAGADAERGRVPLLRAGLSDDEALATVLRYYQQRLGAVPEAQAYLARRGITAAAVAAFGIGVADRTLGLHLPAGTTREGRLVREQLQGVGLLRASGHEAFTGRIVFPITDAAGRALHLYGRRYTDGPVPHLYREGPHAGVFNLPGLQAAAAVPGGGWCVLCEAVIDALSFWCGGQTAVTTAYGVNGFTDAMLETFQALKFRDVLIAYDRDEAGEAGAATAAERLRAVGIRPWRVRFPSGLDANAYTLSMRPADKALGIVLRAAAWLGEGPAPVSPLDRAAVAASSLAAADTAAAAETTESATNPVPAVVCAAAKEEAAASPAGLAAAAGSAGAAAAATPGGALHVQDNVATWTSEGRRYQAQGLSRLVLGEAARVTLRLSCATGSSIDTIDLYQRKQRAAFAAAAAEDCGVDATAVQRDLATLLAELETWLTTRAPAAVAADPVAAMPAAERAAAEALLGAPDLIERSLRDLERCGVIGDAVPKEVGLLALASRLLPRPLALLIQSLSGAGKSTLMDGLLGFLPEEQRVQYSAMTERSVFYLGDGDLRHKVLAVAEEEGVRQAAYALKILQSEGRVTLASTGKDPQTGRLVTHEYTVEGPVMLLLTTTAAELDDELQNRCLVVSVDEARAQTRAVHAVQRLRCTVQGLLRDSQRQALLRLHQNAQRLLRPLPVVIPQAEHLTFPDHQTRLRRDHAKYLALIASGTLLHQRQRPLRTVLHEGQRIEYLESTLEDIARANRLSHQVLGRSVDELAPQTRRLLGLAGGLVGQLAERDGCTRRQVRFTRRALREACGWGDTQLKVHVARLVELEYLIPHRQGQTQATHYELAWEGNTDDSAPQFGGLIEVAELERVHG